MKKTFYVLLALLLSIKANAIEVTIDGLTYDLHSGLDKTATLIGCQKTGDIVVPDSIEVTYEMLPHMASSLTGTAISYEGWYAVDALDGAFSGNQNITSVVLPKRMKYVSGFYNCYSLRSVVLPDSIKEIVPFCFSRTWQLQSIDIPEGVVSIGEYAFEYSAIWDVKLPNTLENIGDVAFRECMNLQSIVIPASVKSIGSSVFSGCEGMKSATILCQIEEIPTYCFNRTKSLEYVEFPQTIKKIGNGAFSNSEALEKINFPENIKVFEAYSFESSGIRELELPASVDSIGERAFAAMKRNENRGGIRLIMVHATTPPKAEFDNTFTNYDNTDWRTYEQVPLEVPVESIELYRNAPVWKNFVTILPLGTTPREHDDDPELVTPEGWTNLIENGNLATDNADNYYSKEAPSTTPVHSRIVELAGKENSHGIIVKSADNPSEVWDTQFWIRMNEQLTIGSKLHVEFDYMANKAAKVSTQSHGEPGQYLDWHCIGDVNFTTEWQHFSTDIEVSADMANMQSIAFNLSEESTATEYHFDNFGVWAQIAEKTENWKNIIVNSDMEDESMECFYVTEQSIGGPFVAVTTVGIGKDGSKAVKVQSADAPTNDWDSQFFIRLPYQLPAGTKYKVSFDYKADKAGDFDTQAHANPGQYIHWAMIGSGSFTTEWQTYEKEGSISADMSKEDNPMQTIAFNLAKNKVATEFIFDNVKFEVPENVIETLSLNPENNPISYNIGVARKTLLDAITTAKAANTEGMTEESVQALNDAIAAAEDALAAEDATVESLNAAKSALEAALAGLVAKPLFADGIYYLFNPAADGFIIGANSWGTRASVSMTGGVEIETEYINGKYELKTGSLYPGKHLGFNGYVDNGDANNNWIIAPVEGQEGLFTLSTDGTNFLFWDGGEVTTTTVGAMPDAVENAYWKFISPEERMALFANANAENPIDATFLISNPNFSRAASTAAWTGDGFSVGGANENQNAEKWGGNSQIFDVHQKITLPNGIYKLTWNGFYRYNNTSDNTNDVATAAHAEGTEVINSFVYLNDKDFALTSIADEAAVEAYGKMPFSQTEASAAFDMGLYEQTAEITIDADTLVIGVKKIEHLGTDWTVWDNFRLSYLGVPAVINPDKDEITVPDGKINLITNGNLAGDDVTSFVAKESPSTEIVSATIIAGAGENNSRGIVVKSVDEAEGADVWNTQFWINLSEALPEGAKLHVEFDYAASKAAKATTQAHGVPGAYQHWAAIGDVNFTTEWQHFSTDIEVNDAMAKGDNGNGIGLLSIAFNLAEEKTATEYYFDNFGVWAELPAPVEEWTDLIVNGNMEGESMECFYVTEQSIGGPFVAVTTDGIGKDDSKAVKVQSADTPTNDWDSQFFIRLPYQLPAGTKYKVSFDYKADKAGDFDTQAHANPGQYIHWAMIGSGSFTTEWQTYEKEGTVPTECDGSESMNEAGEVLYLKFFQTIAFNLAKNKVATEFIFDNVKFEIPTEVANTLTPSPAVDPKPYPVGILTLKNVIKSEVFYNLNGQKVNKTQKGLNLVLMRDGTIRKIVIK